MCNATLYPRLLGAVLLLAGAAAAREPPSLASLARSTLGAGQGVYVEAADGTILLAQAADRAVHPASVSKVPTTLALLRKLGPNYRFATLFAARGRIHDGILEGDLLVSGDNDPYLVDENALLVAQRLNDLGVRRVTGELRSSGPLTFDWQPDNEAVQLRRALSGNAPPAAWEAVRGLSTATTSPPELQFDGAGPQSPGAAGTDAAQPLLIHRSQNLVELAKHLNDFSNNVFKPLAEAAGGASAVEALARSVVPAEMRTEITLGDGAGTDSRNRLSPRTAVKLLRALEQELARSGHRLVDILPVAGVDEGTLHDRLNAPEESGRVVGKTGTFGDYGASALIGAISTSERGTVYFAILNHGVKVSVARRRQDGFVRALLTRLHAQPWDYLHDARPAVARAQLTLADAATP